MAARPGVRSLALKLFESLCMGKISQGELDAVLEDLPVGLSARWAFLQRKAVEFSKRPPSDLYLQCEIQRKMLRERRKMLKG